MQFQSLHGGAKISGHPFGRELGGMNADDDQFTGEFTFQLPQLREDVEAVDSAVGPEVEDDQLAAQVGERERP
jgi:hypothetical protein